MKTRTVAAEGAAVGMLMKQTPFTLTSASREKRRLHMDSVVKSLYARAVPKPAEKVNDNRPTREEAEAAVRTLIRWVSDDPTREGLVETPKRVVDAYEELFSGYGEKPETFLDRTFAEVGGYDDMILVKDIEFYSHCEHHMVPFHGRVHVAYLPDQSVVGLSKLARVVDVFARRLQTQETMTAQIAEAIQTHLKPKGVAVVVEAEHMCMCMRGVRKQGSSTVTSRFTGSFRDNAEERSRFFAMIRGGER